ncbi:MAG: hypothetical protein V7733_10695 [Paraglaciecola polaris]|uniref:hypothetical protein n=1 Tax=Paraglaciecola polaris TaxID=222814 RepID=UPI0030024424
MSHRKYLLGLSFLFTSFQSIGSLVTLNWDVNVNYQYNYVTGVYDDFTPLTRVATATFENTITSSTDSGRTSINQYGDVDGLIYNSPMGEFVSAGRYGADLSLPTSAYAFSDVSDYSSVFFEEVAVSYYVYAYDPILKRSWSYFSQIRLDIRTAPQSGTGVDDYFLTEKGHIDFYHYALDNNLEANYFEYFSEYDSLTSTYLDGYSWSGKAMLSSVSTDTIFVSEPNTFGFICAFICLLPLIRLKLKDMHCSV